MNKNTKLFPYRGWLIALACFLASSIALGGVQYSFGNFIGPLESEFGWSRTQIGDSLSLLAVGTVIAPFVGRLIDRHGSRFIMAGCLLVFGISYLVRPFMTELWHWYAVSILQAFTVAGAAMIPQGKLVGLWFPNNTGKVLSITAMGNNFGGIAIQPMLGVAVAFYSWKTGFLLWGSIAIALSIYTVFVVRNPPSMIIDNDKSTKSDNGAVDHKNYTVYEALRMRQFYAVTLSILCGTFMYNSLLPSIAPHLINNGVSQTTAVSAVSVFAAFGMLGKFVFGIASDKYGARLMLFVDFIGLAIFTFLLIYIVAGFPMWVTIAGTGFFLGAFGALHLLLVIDTFGIKHFGSIMGVVMIANFVPLLVGPRIASLSFDATQSYESAFIITSVIFMIGAISLIFAKPENANHLIDGKL